MAKVTAFLAVNLSLGVQLLDTVVAASASSYSTSDGSYIIECSGKFRYLKNGILDYSATTIKGLKTYYNDVDDRTLHYQVTEISVSGSLYQYYLNKDIDYGPAYVMSYALRGNDKITGSNYDDIFDGGSGNDTINGGAGSDIIYGNIGKDIINGGNDDDVISGDMGADKLTGGTGADTFCFYGAHDSGVGSSKRDTITDFKGSIEGDRIDLSQSLYDYDLLEYQDFVYIGSARFTGSQPEVRFHNGVLQMNAGTDRIADWEIALTGVKSFSADFLIQSSDVTG